MLIELGIAIFELFEKIGEELVIQRVIEWRFLLTPYSTTNYLVRNIKRKRHYIFGIKIVDLA